MNTPNCLPRATVKQWEKASASLLTMLKDYVDLCLNLSPNLLGKDPDSAILAAKFDSTLDSISNQLLKLRPTLLQTRNRLAVPLHRLPDEVLSMIFMHTVFGVECQDIESQSLVEQDVRLIYRRLSGLIGVCSSWRDIIEKGGAFWSMIPVVENPSTGWDPRWLCLKRAGGTKPHFVAAADSPDTARDLELTEVLADYGPSFHKINLHMGDRRVIVDAIDALLEHDTTESLAELTIQYTHATNELPVDDDYVIGLNHPQRASFDRLIGALTAFRIRGAHFYWHTITFSSRLVELHIDKITLGYDHAIIPFLQALSSASELRDLKIIAVDTFLTPGSMPMAETWPPVVFPKLQTLRVQDLFFNTLGTLLPMIAPGSYRLTLFLEKVTLENNLHEDDFPHHPELTRVGISDLCSVLKQVPVHTLMLDRVWGMRLTGTELNELLGGLPTLKALKMRNWHFDRDIWRGLTRPQNKQPGRSFPALEHLQLNSAIILTEEGFREMVVSHPLKRVILGASTPGLSDDTQKKPLKKSSSMAKYLNDNVSEFCLVDPQCCPPEFHLHKLMLWLSSQG